MKVKIKVWIERFALWLLSKIGTTPFIVPVFMNQYFPHILALCEEEEEKVYDTPDMHGDGYFKTRRVMAKMLKEFPELRLQKRALLKAIILCSDSIAFGVKLPTIPLHQ